MKNIRIFIILLLTTVCFYQAQGHNEYSYVENGNEVDTTASQSDIENWNVPVLFWDVVYNTQGASGVPIKWIEPTIPINWLVQGDYTGAIESAIDIWNQVPVDGHFFDHVDLSTDARYSYQSVEHGSVADFFSGFLLSDDLNTI